MSYFDLNSFQETQQRLVRDRHKLSLELTENFQAELAGPQSLICRAIEHVVENPGRSQDLFHLVENAAKLLTGAETWAAYELQWNFMRQLVALRCGVPGRGGLESEVDAFRSIYELLSNSVQNWSGESQVRHATAPFIEAYASAIAACRGTPLSTRKDAWTYVDFVFYCLIQDFKTNESVQRPTERINVLLGANETDGTVIQLVAQQIPGPANAIVPHWFKIGLANLGSQFEMCREVSHAMRSINTGKAILWWLEASGPGMAWHQAIMQGINKQSMAVSVQVPAACVARAVTEIVPAAARPLIDPKAAVSGILVNQPDGNWNCGEVGFLGGKLVAAERAGITTVLFPELANRTEQAKFDQRSSYVKLFWVTTFDQAYRNVLRASSHVWAAKKKTSDEWDKNFIEVETHEDFFKATSKARSFDRSAATESRPRPVAEVSELALDNSRQSVSLDAIFRDDGSVQPEYETLGDQRRDYFLLRQPFWFADTEIIEERWEFAKLEEEPEIDGLESAFKTAPDSEGGGNGKGRDSNHWRRTTREHLLQCAITDDPSWLHVAVVCSAGLGKSTNFKYLEATINRQFEFSGPYFAIYAELFELGRYSTHDELVSRLLLPKLRREKGVSELEVQLAFDRLYDSGRIIFLLDSLDQANHSQNSSTMQRLGELVNPILKPGRDSPCKVWISGRSYAFALAEVELRAMSAKKPWQFLRVGQLDEPEARQLMETGPYIRPLNFAP